jgi:GDP-L-fucose synthase
MPNQLISSSRIYVAGHRGLVGSAIVRRLTELDCRNVVVRTREELDLRDAASVERFFETEEPEFVFLAAAKVGGIMANATQPAEFLYDNLAIQSNVIHSAWKHGVRKLLFLGSSCIYPKMSPQPIKESSLLTGPLEDTNEAYAIAKIAGLKMAAAYRRQYGFQAISLMPTNLYGPGDNFDLKTSHVLPAMIRRFHEAVETGTKEVVLWGTGTPRREFLHVDDAAAAACFAMENYDSIEHLNVGTGEDLTIADLAQMVARVTGYKGRISFDNSKPDGTPRKLLDVSRIQSLGWRPRIALEDGIASTWAWYVSHIAKAMAGLTGTKPGV